MVRRTARHRRPVASVSPLDRRLIALERARAARRLDLRVFSTIAEAKADTEPERPGTTVLRIITRVPRSPNARAP
jgi:hypothetical protein